MNRRKYVELLAKAVPTVITSEQEYDRIVALVDRLAVKRDPSVEEERLLELLSTLVEVYEDERYPIPDAPPYDMIQQFMAARGLAMPTTAARPFAAGAPRASAAAISGFGL